MSRLFALAAVAALVAAFVAPAEGVLAAAPANDNFAAAIAIDPGALPFSTVVDTTNATLEPGEPQNCQGSAPGSTVWYSLTPPADAVATATIGSSQLSPDLSVFTSNGPGFAGLSIVGQTCFGSPTVTFPVQAGTTYYFQAGTLGSGGGVIRLDVSVVPRPVNDNLADATVITALPFADVVDEAAATLEAGEPYPTCQFNTAQGASVWYRITPTVNESVTVSVSDYWTDFVVYSGSSFNDLVALACRTGGGMATFAVAAGSSCYVQVVAQYPFSYPLVHMSAVVAPPPVAAFYLYSSDPSIFDTIQFNDNSYDPAQVGIASWAWDFGDGSTGSGAYPVHRYPSDGDYTAKLTVTTLDGRSASTSQVVHVATHDVAIAKLTVPTSASAGQTRQITVGLTDSRYPETVQVQLFRSSTSGFDLVGSLTQTVPVRPVNRTTSFSFNYTFTSSDAVVGKVTFEAVATIQGFRDALPADNTATALPTKVGK